jgi:hypothetical protein
MLTEESLLRCCCRILRADSPRAMIGFLVIVGSLFSLSPLLSRRMLLCGLGDSEPERSLSTWLLALEPRIVRCRLDDGIVATVVKGLQFNEVR